MNCDSVIKFRGNKYNKIIAEAVEYWGTRSIWHGILQSYDRFECLG